MNPKMAQFPARTILIAFFAIVFIGGTNFVVVKFSNAELPPLYGAGLRFGAAALVLDDHATGSGTDQGIPKSDPITTNAVGMAVGSAGLLAASASFGEPVTVETVAGGAFVLLGVYVGALSGLGCKVRSSITPSPAVQPPAAAQEHSPA